MATKQINLDWLIEGQRPNRQVNSDAAGVSLTVLQTGGLLLCVVATNTGVASGYLHIFDTPSLPANGTVPLLSIQVGAGASVILQTPVACSNGIMLVASSTAATLTSSGTFTMFAQARIS